MSNMNLIPAKVDKSSPLTPCEITVNAAKTHLVFLTKHEGKELAIGFCYEEALAAAAQWADGLEILQAARKHPVQ